MIRCFSSVGGKYETTKGEVPFLPKGKNDFVCLFLEEPSQDEVNNVCSTFKFQQKHFSSYTKEVRSLRYTMRPLVFVFIDYYAEGDNIKKTHVLFAMKKNVLVVITPHKSKYYSELFNKLVSMLKTENIKQNHTAYFLYYFLEEDTRGNYEVLDLIEDKVMVLEESIKKDAQKKPINDIVRLKRKCFSTAKCLWASAKVIFTIKKGLTPLTLDKELLTRMDDVYDTLVHQADMLTVQREILTDMLEIYATFVNNRLAEISNDLNSVMKKLTALTVLIMVPTFITGFYGMNFQYLPYLKTPFGPIIATLFMLAVTGVLYFYFHKKKWT
ncbi:hypothetical protein HY643_03865 [Candidatus Woesearchaeota archaeon]|nr:hypothetical protein [Candidatus Woesearchaeota archaeon]